jgi:hypothetical protein
MPRQHFGLLLDNLGELPFQGSGDAGMDLLASAAQQGVVGGVLHQRMLEGVFRVRRRAAPEHQLGTNELRQGVGQLRLRNLSDSANQLM